MTEANVHKVASLLQQGLELYGTGDIARAFLLWNEALEIDPGNEEALDYMRDADRRSKPRGQSHEAGEASIVEAARRLLRAEGGEAAHELLTNAPAGGSLEAEAMTELLRAHLFRLYHADLRSLTQIPRLVGEVGDLQDRNLPPSAGFLLSMVDGVTALADLISVSGMDRFETLRSIYRMHEAGILEWDQ
ncbi:MAG: hypothetical protein GY910_11185 [bacterium]|nr:hypothetical protein [Deltaproteobacteria bacterium]MCP4905533.1 hypothetical protein [bacterium]